METRVTKEDHWGIYHVKKGSGEKWDSYYNTMDALTPLLELETFARTVSGFYLNICGGFDSVRISYFVDKSDVRTVLLMFTEFFKDNGFVEIEESSPPNPYVVARNYGGEEFEELGLKTEEILFGRLTLPWSLSLRSKSLRSLVKS